MDSGLACHLLGQDIARLGEPDGAAGPMLENFVLMELTRQLSWAEERVRLHHYRTKDRVEVDGVLESADGRGATRVGQAYGLSIHGTIWLLASACSAGKLTETGAGAIIDALRQTGHRLPSTGTEFPSYARRFGLL